MPLPESGRSRRCSRRSPAVCTRCNLCRPSASYVNVGFVTCRAEERGT